MKLSGLAAASAIAALLLSNRGSWQPVPAVVTIGELQLGVLNADEAGMRARRAETLALARTADPLPLSEAVMTTWARLVADCRAAGIHRTVRLTDSLIAATAVEHGLPVVTQDHDFDSIADAHPMLAVVRV